jgi:hypothetical protein
MNSFCELFRSAISALKTGFSSKAALPTHAASVERSRLTPCRLPEIDVVPDHRVAPGGYGDFLVNNVIPKKSRIGKPILFGDIVNDIDPVIARIAQHLLPEGPDCVDGDDEIAKHRKRYAQTVPFQLDVGVTSQGIRSSILEAGWPAAMASNVALR